MKDFNFSTRHLDLMERDAEAVIGWRYEPRIMFERGRGVMIIDVDGNEYYDATSGMMCMSLGHSHPELTETIREQAGGPVSPRQNAESTCDRPDRAGRSEPER